MDPKDHVQIRSYKGKLEASPLTCDSSLLLEDRPSCVVLAPPLRRHKAGTAESAGMTAKAGRKVALLRAFVGLTVAIHMVP